MIPLAGELLRLAVTSPLQVSGSEEEGISVDVQGYINSFRVLRCGVQKDDSPPRGQARWSLPAGCSMKCELMLSRNPFSVYRTQLTDSLTSAKKDRIFPRLLSTSREDLISLSQQMLQPD